jgi:hypothetical protein
MSEMGSVRVGFVVHAIGPRFPTRRDIVVDDRGPASGLIAMMKRSRNRFLGALAGIEAKRKILIL